MSFAEQSDFFSIGQSVEATRRRVCYQGGLPRLVYSSMQDHEARKSQFQILIGFNQVDSSL